MPPRDEERARAAELRSELEALAGEQVLAFGFFGEPGLASSGAWSPGYESLRTTPDTRSEKALLRNLFRRARGRGLPTSVALVATPSRLLAVSYSAGMRGLRPKEVVRAWERAAVRVEVEEETGSRPIVALRDPVTGHSVRLESQDVTGTGVNDEILESLRTGPA